MIPRKRRRRNLIAVERGGRTFREPAGRFRPSHQARSALGVWACSRARADRSALMAWKSAAPYDPGQAVAFGQALAALIRRWSPVLPRDAIVTTPPPGASAARGLPYAAALIGEAAAAALGLRYATALARIGEKTRHGPWAAREQAAFEVLALPDPRPSLVLVLDDAATSGRTMRLALEALRGAGLMAFGFVFTGV